MSGTGLSAKAKPFVFNPNAGSFNPTAAAFAPAAAGAASTPDPIAERPVDTFDLSSDAHPMTAPSAGGSDSWEDLAEEKAQATRPIPVPTSHPSPVLTAPVAASPPPPASSSPPPQLHSSPTPVPPTSSSPPPPASASSSPDLNLSSTTAALALDEEEAKLLSEAAEEEAAEAAEPEKKAKKLDTDRVAHDDREHINIVFIGHVDAGKSTISGQILSVPSAHPHAALCVPSVV